MLACARIGATHSVVFGGFSADALRRPDPGRRTPSSSSPPTAATGAASRRALKPTVDEAVGAVPDASSTCWSSAAPARTSPGPTAATVVARDRRAGQRRAHARSRSTPSTRCSSSTPRGTTAKPKGILHTTGGYLTQVALHPPRGLRPQAGDRRLLVHRRHRLGHRALATSSTGRCPTAPPRSCTRARRTPRTRAGSGRSSRSTGSRSSTPRRPRSARS